jgi:hypothetical protein
MTMSAVVRPVADQDIHGRARKFHFAHDRDPLSMPTLTKESLCKSPSSAPDM